MKKEENLQELTAEELEAVAGAYWRWNGHRWVWVPPPRHPNGNRPR